VKRPERTLGNLASGTSSVVATSTKKDGWGGRVFALKLLAVLALDTLGNRCRDVARVNTPFGLAKREQDARNGH